MPLRFAYEEGGRRLTTSATPSPLPQKTKNENLAEKLGLSRQDLEHVVILDLIKTVPSIELLTCHTFNNFFYQPLQSSWCCNNDQIHRRTWAIRMILQTHFVLSRLSTLGETSYWCVFGFCSEKKLQGGRYQHTERNQVIYVNHYSIDRRSPISTTLNTITRILFTVESNLFW